MNSPILITGAAGNVGREIIARLPKSASIRAGERTIEGASKDLPPNVDVVHLDFTDASTYAAGLQGVKKLFLVRPPAISDVKNVMGPFIWAAQGAGVEHIVFLSLLGAEKNPIVPHASIEKVILKTGMTYTFLRPSFFMQNLSTTHLDEIKTLNKILLPAGNGRTSFIDVRDIAAVAAKVLVQKGHENKAYALTGSEALTYTEVAQLLTEELKRPIEYDKASLWKFWRFHRAKGVNASFIVVMMGIYTTARLGLAGTITPTLQDLLGRAPITMKQFVHDYRAMWG